MKRPASTPDFFADIAPAVLRLKARFDERGEKLAFAESCTGGLLSAVLARQAGVSTFFLGSVVSYHRNVKNKILGVPMDVIQSLGEVSEPVGLAMAEGARRAIGSDWAVAVTGIAGPSGGSTEKPVGTVCFGLAGPGVSQATTKYFGAENSRQVIQQATVRYAIDLLLNFNKLD